MTRRTGFLLMPGALLAASLLLAAGCLAPGGGDTLEGTSWDLTSYRSIDGTMTGIIPGTRVTVTFSTGGKLGGSGGCNHFFGNYMAAGSTLRIGQVGSTLMACLDPGVMDQESRYLSLLGSAASFRFAGDRLSISDAGGTEILVFDREKPPVPLPLTGTAWKLDSLSTGTGGISSLIAGTEINADFSTGGRVTGSAGCNQYFADYSTSGTTLSIGTAGATKKFCGDPPGLMEQEQRYLSLLGSVAAYEITGDRLVLKDSAGSGILFFRGA